MLTLVQGILGFVATPALRPSVAASPRLAASPSMGLNPLDAVASPLRKFEAPAASQAAAAADNGSILDGLPIEVGLLFGAIAFVAIAGLIKQSGALSETAPTIGLGESREELSEQAEEAKELSQAEKEKQYFAVLAEEVASKRGGSKSKRKKSKKK